MDVGLGGVGAGGEAATSAELVEATDRPAMPALAIQDDDGAAKGGRSVAKEFGTECNRHRDIESEPRLAGAPLADDGRALRSRQYSGDQPLAGKDGVGAVFGEAEVGMRQVGERFGRGEFVGVDHTLVEVDEVHGRRGGSIPVPDSEGGVPGGVAASEAVECRAMDGFLAVTRTGNGPRVGVEGRGIYWLGGRAVGFSEPAGELRRGCGVARVMAGTTDGLSCHLVSLRLLRWPG